MIKNFCLITEHQDIEGLQRMHSYSPPPEIFDEKIDFQTVRPGSWKSDASSSVFMNLKSGRQNNCYSKNAEGIRDGLAEYFYGTGSVPWQCGLLV